jgi:hypothetical protein
MINRREALHLADVRFSSLSLLAGLSVGCKTSSAPDTGFNQGAEQTERFPFQRVWVKPGVDRARQCAELANTPRTRKVKGRSKFPLKPW